MNSKAVKVLMTVNIIMPNWDLTRMTDTASFHAAAAA